MAVMMFLINLCIFVLFCQSTYQSLAPAAVARRVVVVLARNDLGLGSLSDRDGLGFFLVVHDQLLCVFTM